MGISFTYRLPSEFHPGNRCFTYPYLFSSDIDDVLQSFVLMLEKTTTFQRGCLLFVLRFLLTLYYEV